MTISFQSRFRRLATGLALYVVLGFSLLPYAADGQGTQSQADQVAASIANVKAGRFNNIDLEIVAQAGASQSVLPDLESLFAAATGATRQGILASALVTLGDRDNTYWNFLLQQATLAVDSDVPDAIHDLKGNVIERQLSPELSVWAKAHHVDLNTARQLALYELPGAVFLLGATGDSRGIPLLRRALQSQNFMIVVTAARGLAQIQDKDSIPLIIEVCRRAPKGTDSAIAEASLVFFDDPQAQSAVDTFVPKDRAKIWRDARAHGMKPFGY